MSALELVTLGAYLVGIAKAGGSLPVNWTFKVGRQRWALRGWLETVPPTETLGPPLPPKKEPPTSGAPMIPPANAGAL